MDRAAALQKIRQAREAKGLSYDDLGKAIGTKDTMYIAAALHGQHRLNAEEAKQLAQGHAAPHGLSAHHGPFQVPAHGAGRGLRGCPPGALERALG